MGLTVGNGVLGEGSLMTPGFPFHYYSSNVPYL